MYKNYFDRTQSLNHTVIKESCFTHFEAIFVHLAIIKFDDGAGKISLLIITWQSQRVMDPGLKKLGPGFSQETKIQNSFKIDFAL